MSKKNKDEVVDLLPTVLTVTEIGVSVAKAKAERVVADPKEDDLEQILEENELKKGVGGQKSE